MKPIKFDTGDGYISVEHCPTPDAYSIVQHNRPDNAWATCCPLMTFEQIEEMYLLIKSRREK